MAILKNKTQGNFVMVSQNIMRDENLGLTERGLLITLLSLPDGWNLSIAGLTHILPDGKDKVAKSLNILIKAGYVTREQGRANRGKFGSNVLEVHETPVQSEEISNQDNTEEKQNSSDLPCPENPSTENPVTVKPDTDKPSTENPQQYNNKYINNKELNNNKLKNKECEKETLTTEDYERLIAEFGKDLVDYQINRINQKHYIGYMNYISIRQWCKEACKKSNSSEKSSNGHSQSDRNYNWSELEEELLKGGI